MRFCDRKLDSSRKPPCGGMTRLKKLHLENMAASMGYRTWARREKFSEISQKKSKRSVGIGVKNARIGRGAEN
jgi:hypothetical protein